MKKDCLRPDLITKNTHDKIMQTQTNQKEYYDRRTTNKKNLFNKTDKSTNSKYELLNRGKGRINKKLLELKSHPVELENNEKTNAIHFLKLYKKL